MRQILGRQLALLGALILPAGAPARGAVVFHNIAYLSPGAPNGEHLLDLYFPSSGTPTEPYTVVVVHGGSYWAGNKADNAGFAAALADLGYAVVCPNYTLVTPLPSGPGPGTFPQPINDILNVVRWIRTDGVLLDVPNPVILSGGSAGATIALQAAMVQNGPGFSPLPAPPNRGYTIDGAFGVAGRYDLLWNAQNIGVPLTVVQYVGSYSWTAGGPAIYAQASATSFTNSCSPPTVLYHGDADATVPFGNSYRLTQSLQAAGAPVRLIINAGANHNNPTLTYSNQSAALLTRDAIHWIAAHAQPQCGRAAPPEPPAAPGPVGTCCTFDARCYLVELLNCSAGALWAPDTTCAPGPCRAGACCDPSGACTLSLLGGCPGDWRGPNSPCLPTTCPQIGACCAGAICLIQSSDQCSSPGRRFVGPNSACNILDNHTQPCCIADFNQNAAISVGDIFDFLSNWFAGSATVACAGAPAAGPVVEDIFVFLRAWFAGC